jgi:hypothetical protein
MIRRLICRVFSHTWDIQPNMIPDDRDTYKCRRCSEITLHPPSVGKPTVPKEDRINAD